LRKFVVTTLVAATAVLAAAAAANALPGGSFSFGGRTFGGQANVTGGWVSTEDPDKIMSGDPSGISVQRFGLEIDPNAEVNQIVTTDTK
jgi:hypothetical protein